MDLKYAYQQLNKYLCLQTYPVALSLFEKREDLPNSCRDNAKVVGAMPVCQLISVARRYGWNVAMQSNEMTCPLGAISLGFVEASKDHLAGCAEVPTWVRTKEARARIMQSLPKFELGRYSHIVVAPLAKADFDPQIILVYGNPAQMMRLVQSAIYLTGEPVVSNTLGAVGCTTYITKAIQTNDYQMVVSGAGDRIFALTQDHEMSFTIPADKLDSVLKGLKETTRYGMRYPTPSYLRFKPELPDTYSNLMDDLNAKPPKCSTGI